MPDHYDVAVLGGGSGGYVGAIRAAQLGMRVAVVEEDKVGGTCLHRGCIPTKALLQTAALLDQIAGGGRLGVTAREVSLDYPAAAAHRTGVVSKLHRGVEYLLKKNRVDLIAGRGRLQGPRGLTVDTADGRREIAADAIIVATGSRPRSLPGIDVDGRTVVTSDEALDREQPPRSAIILGAGAIGVEFASMYRSFGAEVTLVEMAGEVVPLEDDAIGAEVRRQFEARGIQCLVSHQLDAASLERNEGGIAVTARGPDGERRLQAELLLVAVGRSANTDDIGLDSVAVELDGGRLRVDGRMGTGQQGVLAVGDVAGGFWLAHKAMHEGVVAAEAIAGRDPHPIDQNTVPRTTYCTPQIGSVGLSEAEAREAGHDVAVGTFPFQANGRALIWGEPGGLCKVVTDRRTNDVLGVHIVGHEVTELIAGPALGMLLEATPFEVGRSIAPHPTLSEVLGEAALAISGEAIHL